MALGQAGGDVVIGQLIKYGNFPTNFSDCGNKGGRRHCLHNQIKDAEPGDGGIPILQGPAR